MFYEDNKKVKLTIVLNESFAFSFTHTLIYRSYILFSFIIIVLFFELLRFVTQGDSRSIAP